MKRFLYKTNGYNGVALQYNNKIYDCKIDENGKLDGEVDIYSENPIPNLKEYFNNISIDLDIFKNKECCYLKKDFFDDSMKIIEF